MMHRAWSSIVVVPYCFSRSSVKFQGHTALKIVEFDHNWAFPDYNSSLNSPMAMKCCTKLETAKERCPIVFQGHPLNFEVTRYKTSPKLTQIGRFRTIGRSQLSNPSDLPCFYPFNMRRFIVRSCELQSHANPYWKRHITLTVTRRHRHQRILKDVINYKITFRGERSFRFHRKSVKVYIPIACVDNISIKRCAVVLQNICVARWHSLQYEGTGYC